MRCVTDPSACYTFSYDIYVFEIKYNIHVRLQYNLLYVTVSATVHAMARLPKTL